MADTLAPDRPGPRRPVPGPGAGAGADATAPLVSVVLAAHNSPVAVVEALRTVAQQRLTEEQPGAVAVVVVDDASTDQTAEAAREAMTALRLPGDLVRLDSRQGLAGARNTGVAASQGRYVSFIDPDVRWHADKLGVQIARLEADPDITLCLTQGRWCGGDDPGHGGFGEPPRRDGIGDNLPALAADGWRALLCAGPVPATCAMARRIDLGLRPFDTTLPLGAEQDLWIKLASNGATAVVPGHWVDCPAQLQAACPDNWPAALAAARAMIEGHVADFADHLSLFERRRARGRVYADVGHALVADPARRRQAAPLLARAALAGVDPLRLGWQALRLVMGAGPGR